MRVLILSTGRRQRPNKKPQSKKVGVRKRKGGKTPDFDVTKASQRMKEGVGLAKGLGEEVGRLIRGQAAEVQRWGQKCCEVPGWVQVTTIAEIDVLGTRKGCEAEKQRSGSSTRDPDFDVAGASK